MRPKPITIQARMDGGVLEIAANVKRQREAAMKGWPNGPVDIEFRPFEETRRGRANRYYFGVVLKMIADESGYTKDDLHELFALRHNGKDVVDPVSGEEKRIAQSTASLKIGEFSVYLERVMLDGAEVYGMTFPAPRASEEYRDASEV